MKQLQKEFDTFGAATRTELTMYDGNHHGFVFYSNEKEARAALNAVRSKYKARYAMIRPNEKNEIKPHQDRAEWSRH